MLGSGRVTLYKGKGCPACAHTGYKGRTAVFELLPMNDRIKDLLIAGEPVKKIKEENKKAGMNTLKEAALQKVMQGITTVEELETFPEAYRPREESAAQRPQVSSVQTLVL